MRNVYIFYEDGATIGRFVVDFLNFLPATRVLNLKRDIRKNNIFGEQRTGKVRKFKEMRPNSCNGNSLIFLITYNFSFI